MQKKKAPDRSYGEKLIALFAKLLFTGRAYSLTELARRLACSKQTVLRLIDDITLAYDVPVRDEMRGNRKYVWIERRGESDGLEPAALLSESEHRTLQMCRAFTEHLLGRETFAEVERALEKSGHHLPPGLESDEAVFGVVRSGVIDYSAHEGVLRVLLQGMEERRVCEIDYQALTAPEPKTFRIKPLKVFAHRETVYVHARKARMPGKPYKAPKFDPLLALQRFRGARLTEVKFRRPAGYDFEKVMNQGFGVWNQKRFWVEMELTGWAAAFAAERVWSPEQDIKELGDGKIRLGFWASSAPEIVSLALGFGRNAKIIKPVELATECRNEAEAILALST